MDTQQVPVRATPEPMPANIPSAQPGGGVCYRIELAWGRWRRWWLKHFRPGYVRRMAALAAGRRAGAPHEILDPRDLKYCRKQCDCRWDEADDPFRWRDRLPFARWGAAELQLMGGPLLAADRRLGGWSSGTWRWCPARSLCLVVYFFRDPPRRVPEEPVSLVSPADGTVAEVTPAGARRVHRRPGRADRHFPVDLQRPLEPVAGCVPGDRPAVLARRVPQRAEARKRDAQREHVDRPGGGGAAASPHGRAADFRGRSPGGSSATCGPAKCSAADRSSA